MIGATNLPDSIDSSLRRPGRFDREFEIGIPNANGRKEILEIFLSKQANMFNYTLSSDQIQLISSSTHGFVGADLLQLCKEAVLHASERETNSNQQSNKVLNVNFEDFIEKDY